MSPNAPASRPRASSRRRVTRILAGASLVIGIGSCASTLKLDEYRSASSELCGLLDQCFDVAGASSCQADVESAINRSNGDVVTTWLGNFGDLSCLESCSTARRCLDLQPLCVEGAETTCERQEDCCGFSQGLTDCKDSTCCSRSGVECKRDSDCCGDAGACRRSAENPGILTCGGTICRPSKAVCTINAQCCTGTCVDGHCADTSCFENKYRCATNNDCCNKFCDPASSRCADPKTCSGPGQACLVPEECCESTFTCQHDPGSITGTCVDSMCLRHDAECATDDQCCTGHCDPAYFKCGELCSDQSALCMKDAECCSGHCNDGACEASCSIGYCAVAADCCTGSCLSGVCAPVCNPVVVSDGVCTTHAQPLDGEGNNACVLKVCETDPYCCCGAWDALCVLAAKSAVGVCTCP